MSNLLESLLEHPATRNHSLDSPPTKLVENQLSPGQSYAHSIIQVALEASRDSADSPEPSPSLDLPTIIPLLKHHLHTLLSTNQNLLLPPLLLLASPADGVDGGKGDDTLRRLEEEVRREEVNVTATVGNIQAATGRARKLAGDKLSEIDGLNTRIRNILETTKIATTCKTILSECARLRGVLKGHGLGQGTSGVSGVGQGTASDVSSYNIGSLSPRALGRIAKSTRTINDAAAGTPSVLKIPPVAAAVTFSKALSARTLSVSSSALDKCFFSADQSASVTGGPSQNVSQWLSVLDNLGSLPSVVTELLTTTIAKITDDLRDTCECVFAFMQLDLQLDLQLGLPRCLRMCFTCCVSHAFQSFQWLQ